MPPEPEVVEAFLGDGREGAFGRVVEGLLESPHYGERWGRHWLDVARYSDGLGGFLDSAPLPEAWRYRDWVVNALNRDLPYDRFVLHQIAGDQLPSIEAGLATGFLSLGPTYISDGGDPEAEAQARAETLADRVDTFSRAFLGLTVACAQCHDHKFDPIFMADYYALAGVFNNCKETEWPLVSREVVDAYHQSRREIKANEDRMNRFLEEQAKQLGIERKGIEKKLPVESKTQLDAMRADLERMKAVAPSKYPFGHGLTDSGTEDMNIAIRGNLRKPGPPAPRRFLSALEGEDAKRFEHGSGRLELAEALIAPGNPLTARVIVNRLWLHHFGSGLVGTPSNYGTLGETPTHPELLDWLAAEFIRGGWSIKRLHRLILLSSTWQMSSEIRPDYFSRDPDNRLFDFPTPRASNEGRLISTTPQQFHFAMNRVQGGIAYGATDEFGLSAVENRVHVRDLHATILHLMGLDHTRLTYRYSGRDYRLTDVHGDVIRGILT